MQTFRTLLLASILNLGLTAGASAATITFDALPGNAFDNLNSYSEAGFLVANPNGNFRVDTTFGGPAPSILTIPGTFNGAPPSAIVIVTRLDGGGFTFGGLDLASSNGGTLYSITGSVAGANLISLSGLKVSGGFSTIASNRDIVINRLFISLTSAATSASIDNIQVTAVAPVSVPEPAALALLLSGLAGLGVARRRA